MSLYNKNKLNIYVKKTIGTLPLTSCCAHILIVLLDIFLVVFLDSSDVLSLSTSYMLLQMTQLGLIRAKFVSS